MKIINVAHKIKNKQISRFDQRCVAFNIWRWNGQTCEAYAEATHLILAWQDRYNKTIL